MNHVSIATQMPALRLKLLHERNLPVEKTVIITSLEAVILKPVIIVIRAIILPGLII